jgi:16S rRNA processing protein RimM
VAGRPVQSTADRLVVGLVRGVHGLRGAVRVEILTDNPGRFEPGSLLFPENSERRLTVLSAHRDGPGLLVRFAEIVDRNGAEELRDTYLEAAQSAELPERTFYWHDIVGCTVTTRAGELLGVVDDVFRVGESEVYVVHGGRGELLVPAVQSVIVELAPSDKRLVVDERALGLVRAGEGDER